ncbi:hypothetical protein D3C76_1808880 [compost metagenome]
MAEKIEDKQPHTQGEHRRRRHQHQEVHLNFQLHIQIAHAENAFQVHLSNARSGK